MDFKDYVLENSTFKIKVIPNSSQNEIIGELEEGVFKVKARGVPEKGKVNKEIIKYFSKYLKIPQKDINIISGEKNKLKTIKIEK